MKGSLIYLGLATLAIATPVPQHEHKTPEKPAFLQGGAPATPLGLFKITSKGSPVSKKSGVVRDQLYYGPLSLKTVAVSFFSFKKHKRELLFCPEIWKLICSSNEKLKLASSLEWTHKEMYSITSCLISQVMSLC